MKHARPNFTFFSLLAVGATAFAFDGYPQTDRLEPRTAQVGTVITITGKALDKEHVDEVYLTDHRFDMKVKVLEQSDTTLKIRVPPFAKPGRLQLLLLTSGDKPAYLEQPLYVQVNEGDAETSVTPAPVEVTQKEKRKQQAPPTQRKPANTVEIAAIGTHIPVPAAANNKARPDPVKREEPQAAPQAAAPVLVSPAPVPAAVPQQQAVPAVMGENSRVTQPRLMKRNPVTMPSLPPSMGGDGTVELLVQIRTDGRVGSIKAIRGNPILAQAATRSVRDWVYESAYVGSTPVETEITILLNFKR